MNLFYLMRETLRKRGPLTRNALFAALTRYVNPAKAIGQVKNNGKISKGLRKHRTKTTEELIKQGAMELLRKYFSTEIRRGHIKEENGLCHFVHHPGEAHDRKVTLYLRIKEAVERLAPCTLEQVVADVRLKIPYSVFSKSGNVVKNPRTGRPHPELSRRRFVYRTLSKLITRKHVIRAEDGRYISSNGRVT